MRWNRITPIALALGLASSVGAATLAAAAPAAPARLGNFGSWHAAQSAAGFHLLRPTKTYRLKRNGDISVMKCAVRGQGAKHVVTARYGLTPRAGLGISQDNYGRSCLTNGPSKRLGHYRVGRASALLVGYCGRRGLPSCRSKNILMQLSWRRNGIYYVATSYGETRATIVGFARGLTRVR